MILSILYHNLREHTIVIIFLPININMCFGCSKEPSHVLTCYNMSIMKKKHANFFEKRVVQPLTDTSRGL